MTAYQFFAVVAPLITAAVAVMTALIVKRIFIRPAEKREKPSAPAGMVEVNTSKQQIIDELERTKILIDRALRSISAP